MAKETAPATRAPVAKSTVENIKDTLESIVVAFILAFIFRAFIVEAFVIPTGSMAVTLYGNQVTNTCSTCGYEYARGIDQNEQEQAIRLRLAKLPLKCPNCDTTPDHVDQAGLIHPDSGDRILVHKWPLDVASHALGPKRFDVTVFKDPTDGTTNFIKRLAGLPGEVLEIIDGDIYTAPLEPTKDHPGLNKAAPGLVERLEQLRQDVYNWGATGQGSPDEIKRRYQEINEELLPHLRIRRKILEAPRAQQALWVNVYNHDFLPNYDRFNNAEGGAAGIRRVGWYEEGSVRAWDTSQREIVFRPPAPNAGPVFICFDGKPIDDFSAYNSEHNNSYPNKVGDVRLRFTWFPENTAGNGGIVLRMNRDEATFTAEIAANGSARIIHAQPGMTGGQTVIAERSQLFNPGQAINIEFMNVDYVVRLIVNDNILESKSSQYEPDVVRIMKKRQGETYDVKPTEVRIGALGIPCRLRHVVLERDVYYRDTHQVEPGRIVNPQTGVTRTNPYLGWPGWGTAGMPILLRSERWVNGRKLPGEYFMLGDNSPASKDSRLWWEIGPHLVAMGPEYTVGTVSGDQLIGEAFFVYWPAGYRRPWAGNVGFIPNVGRMRWIR
ncbi:MAG TPA: S26 family signal peptidase [Phycisphaerae bacterium]|nr:hypothetical protein [Phycisphaerae bacterium]HOB74167.1 S26 family signal peptidase [Phycisphaerae bacterium]HOJ55909.1 S26 family signal peptidase [Phycisphaerae bacterium]HOL27625.1 S26 family signal peptidase [Phycisphaerae bacterium]HPP22173.1 S26 family signal peptidase [Phycisphaerae bacterium]